MKYYYQYHHTTATPPYSRQLKTAGGRGRMSAQRYKISSLEKHPTPDNRVQKPCQSYQVTRKHYNHDSYDHRHLPYTTIATTTTVATSCSSSHRSSNQ